MRALLATLLVLAAPAVTTGDASSIGQTTATIAGTVDPNGAATTYHFEYGTTTSYGLTTADTAAGDGTPSVDVKATLSGLTSDTTYHYRLVARTPPARARRRPHASTPRPTRRAPGARPAPRATCARTARR